jgi:uncharacterized protein
MTPQESQVLQTFLTQLTQAQVSAKDSEAQAMINTAVAQQPDAAYLLVQRALLLDQALQQAKSQIAQLQEQQRNAAGGGAAWNQAWSSPPAAPPAPTNAPQAQMAPPSPSTPQAQPTSPAASTSSGWGGFLGNAATTAAGVAGGAFLVQGLEGLFGHHGGGGGGFFGGGAPTETVENITVNEYRDDPDPSRSAGADDQELAQDVNADPDDVEASNFDSTDASDAAFDDDEDDGDDDSSWA